MMRLPASHAIARYGRHTAVVSPPAAAARRASRRAAIFLFHVTRAADAHMQRYQPSTRRRHAVLLEMRAHASDAARRVLRRRFICCRRLNRLPCPRCRLSAWRGARSADMRRYGASAIAGRQRAAGETRDDAQARCARHAAAEKRSERASRRVLLRDASATRMKACLMPAFLLMMPPTEPRCHRCGASVRAMPVYLRRSPRYFFFCHCCHASDIFPLMSYHVAAALSGAAAPSARARR